MARFKLKFRMGGSRSTSQEHDPDPQVNEALLNHHQQEQQHGTSTSTLDSADCNSLASLGANSERRSLLPNTSTGKSNNFRLGYLNPTSANEISANKADSTIVPSTPPPSYEHVLEELQNIHLSSQYVHSPQRQISNSTSHGSGESLHRQSRRSSVNSVQTNHLEQLYEIETCNDPNCEENIAYNERQRIQREQDLKLNGGTIDNENSNNINYDHNIANEIRVQRKDSIDSSDYLISTNMTAPASAENLLNECTSECQEYDVDEYGSGAYGGGGSAGGGSRCSSNGNASGSCNGNSNNDFCDPLMNHGNYCNNESHSHNQLSHDSNIHDDACSHSSHHHQQQQQQQHQHYQQQQQQHQHYQQQQQQLQQQQSLLRRVRNLTPEIISNKSSKEIYKDLAKQWGITCKMSDGCRCMDCQSHYFDCEFEENEHQKSDGGLGAGTPMFISEVMHGSACHIL